MSIHFSDIMSVSEARIESLRLLPKYLLPKTRPAARLLGLRYL
jgi:hypothetical protein